MKILAQGQLPNPESRVRHWPMVAIKPWIISAVIWEFVSLVIVAEYLKLGTTQHVDEFWLILSFLWLLFGFAAVFNALMRTRVRDLVPLILIAIVPPLTLYLLIHSVLFVLSINTP